MNGPDLLTPRMQKPESRLGGRGIFLRLSKSDKALMTMLWLVAATAMVIAALRRGPDMNWDLRNYHFYGAYFLLHGGNDRHFFPAQLQSWYNPTFHILTLALIQNLPRVGVAIVQAVIESLNAPLIFIIARQILDPALSKTPLWSRAAVLSAAVVVGVTGAMTLSEIATSMGDNVVSLPLLAALAALGHAFGIKENAQSDHSPKISSWIILGGFMAGLAIGLKLTAVVFAPGFALCALWNARRFKQAVGIGALFGASALTGFLLTGGYWTWHLWESTGNPLFPLMNQIFRSPWMDPVSLSDDRFRPHSVLAALAFSFKTALGQHPGAELGFRDIRFALFIVLLPVLFYKRPRGWPGAMLVFYLVSFGIWLCLFGIERYAVLLEMLSGSVLLLLIGLWVGRRWKPAVMLIAAVIVVVSTRAPDWGHGHWVQDQPGGNWFDLKVPPELAGSDEMFLMLDDYPEAYVVPFFPQDSRFVRMEGNLRPSSTMLLFQKRREAIRDHTGPFFTIGPHEPTAAQETMLAEYGLHRDNSVCNPLRSAIETLTVCKIIRTKGGERAWGEHENFVSDQKQFARF